jgi:hypothetical protein
VSGTSVDDVVAEGVENDELDEVAEVMELKADDAMDDSVSDTEAPELVDDMTPDRFWGVV